MCFRPSSPPSVLGRRIASYRASPEVHRRAMWSVAAGLVLGVLCVGLLPSRDAWQRLYAAGAALTLLSAGVMVGHRQRRFRVELYQHGMLVASGRRIRRVGWEQIREFYRTPCTDLLIPAARGTAGTRLPTLYTLRCVDGRRIRLCGLEGMESLGWRIEQFLTRRLYAVYCEAYRVGYLIRFGPQLGLCQEGIVLRRAFVGWQMIRQLRWDERYGVVIVPRDGQRPVIRIAPERIAHVHLLMSVLDWIFRETDAKYVGLQGGGGPNDLPWASQVEGLGGIGVDDADSLRPPCPSGELRGCDESDEPEWDRPRRPK